ncbi:hypothetical protein SEVIR_3G180533v4 [Setaria viridis]
MFLFIPRSWPAASFSSPLLSFLLLGRTQLACARPFSRAMDRTGGGCRPGASNRPATGRGGARSARLRALVTAEAGTGCPLSRDHLSIVHREFQA